MPDFPFLSFAAGFGWATLGVVVLLAATFALAQIQKRHSVIDTAWGLGFVVIAAITFFTSADVAGGSAGDDGRRVLMLILTAAWGLRLAGFIGWRARDGAEDPRYEDMLSDAPGSRNAYALRKIYLTQGVVMLFVSLPVQVAMYSTGPLGWLAWVGAVIWLVGFFFETVGDYQMAAFRGNPANKGTVMDKGLWRYTRHPNYFGDAAVWVGLFLVAADSWPGVLTILSPALMFWTLSNKTGKPLTEKRLSTRPGYREYIENTSGLFPLPPKPGRGASS
ncbi:DUF1295 domain-containing protein [Arthrobacter sp. 260]|uniref:DUF1295 domain-containing protein n=1 Tax=Arthrobacter sp. 260 TaxID=2735314 RepID=UPI0014923B90|nr:DUF1295 domain-containing protein [Arthrobacter sp. 260]NOJ60644.1 DUF1295 domain-containing protein [Arthrobacter sp. 260]